MNKSWKQRLASMGIAYKEKAIPNMIFEIDDVTGAKLVFPDIADLTELAEGVTVTAEDGDHVFEAEGNTYTVTVLGGKVTKIDIVPLEAMATEMSAETAGFVTAVAEQLEAQEVLNTEMKAQLTSAHTLISEMKAMMSHGKDDLQAQVKEILVGGKTIDLTKVKFK